MELTLNPNDLGQLVLISGFIAMVVILLNYVLYKRAQHEGVMTSQQAQEISLRLFLWPQGTGMPRR